MLAPQSKISRLYARSSWFFNTRALVIKFAGTACLAIALGSMLTADGRVAAQELAPPGQAETSTEPASSDSPALDFNTDMDVDFGADFGSDFGDLPEGMEDFASGDFGGVGPSEEEIAAARAVATAMSIGLGLIGLVMLAFLVWVAYSMMSALSVLPEQHQQLQPWVPWLLLVPLVNIVVLFLVFIKVPDSMRSYLASIGDTSLGDCGKSNGLWGSVLYILGCTFPIGLVLLVMAVFKVNQAKRQASA